MAEDAIELDLDSSPGSETLDAAVEAKAEAAPAESSPAKDELTEREQLLQVVKDVGVKAPEAAASSADKGAEAGSTAEKPAKEVDNEAFTDVPFHKHPRFREVLRQRDTYRTDAERYQNVETFLQTNGLSGDEAADGLRIMGLMKTDPVKAWQEIKPTIQNLLIAAGEVLPDDLRSMVAQGQMTQEAAQEMARTRARADSVERRSTWERQSAEQRYYAQTAQAITSTVTDWQADRERADPNFQAKLPRIQREIAYLQMQEGKPATPQGAIGQLKRAYEAVNAEFIPPAAAQRQAKPAIKPVVGGRVAGNVQAEPKSVLDIVRMHSKG